MDKLNNNNNEKCNSYDNNFDSYSVVCDDVRNHNESRTTARITPLSYQNNRNPKLSFDPQEFVRSNVDRMKDRQMAILKQKNNQLQTELLAMRQKYPVLHEYSMMGQFNTGNKHLLLQVKLLTTALSEKFEELRQAKEELRQTKKEYDLVMQERTMVHRELQEQTIEIDTLKEKNQILQEKLNLECLNGGESAENQRGTLSRLNSTLNETCETLKSEIISLESTIKDLTVRNERSSLQLNSVLDKYHKLKMFLSNGLNSKRDLKSLSAGPRFHQRFATGTVKVIDLKMVLLKIAYENVGTTDDDDDDAAAAAATAVNKNVCDTTVTGVNAGRDISGAGTVTAGTAPLFHLRFDDHLLDIEGTPVSDWSNNQILDYLSRFDANAHVQVIVSRAAQSSGKFVSWKAKLDTTSGLCLSPLWMVRSESHDEELGFLRFGDILQLNDENAANSDGVVSVNVVRLDPFPLETNPTDLVDYNERLEVPASNSYRGYNLDKMNPNNSKEMSMRSSDQFSGCLLGSTSLFPVLPLKKNLLLLNKSPYKSSHCPVRNVSDYNLFEHSNMSVSSAPPVPPRSSTSLQYSFMENFDPQNASNTDMDTVENREFEKEVFCLSENEKMNLSVQSAIQFDFHSSMDTASRELMSASFNCPSEYSTHKIPKLGKCRKVTLTVPSKIFCLRDLGLHLLHGKTEEALISKSDVDLSVINQIFIRNIELNSIAHNAGLVEGDEIITINNHSVSKMTAEETENVFLNNPLKPGRQKYSLLIKVQFNPIKMHELFKEKYLLPLNRNLPSIRFTRSMYDETHSSRSIHDKELSHRLHVIRSTSNLNVVGVDEAENFKLKNNLVHHLQTHPRMIRINFYSVLKLIKIMGGSNTGIFISNVIYKDSQAEIKEKESIGNRLAVGDKILEVNGEKFDRIIGDLAVESLNKLSNQTTIKVLYNPTGLLEINSDPYCQEHFYMEATFSFSELHNPLTSFSGKREKAASVCSRLDHLVVNIPFERNYHLRFEKHDILLVDATILPTAMTKNNAEDKTCPSDWHAWVVDRRNNKIRQGMIPSAFWLEKMLYLQTKSFKLPITDTYVKSSMRSTPSSPISETHEFLSSPSTSFHNETSKLFNSQHSSLGQRIFGRMSFKSHSHTKTVSSDDRNNGISFQKFQPLKRRPRVTDSYRPLVLLGAHSDTITMALASSRPQQYMIVQSVNSLEWPTNSLLHFILPVKLKETIGELHEKNIFPIVLLLNYKSAKHIRQIRICKTSQIKVSKSDSHKLFAQIKELETKWSHLINDCVFPSHVPDMCDEIVRKVDTLQAEDVWLHSDRFEYSN